jgi:hypothetical protein
MGQWNFAQEFSSLQIISYKIVFLRIWVILLFDYASPHAECEGTGDLNVEEQVSNFALNPLDCIIKAFSNYWLHMACTHASLSAITTIPSHWTSCSFVLFYLALLINANRKSSWILSASSTGLLTGVHQLSKSLFFCTLTPYVECAVLGVGGRECQMSILWGIRLSVLWSMFRW